MVLIFDILNGGCFIFAVVENVLENVVFPKFILEKSYLPQQKCLDLELNFQLFN